MFQRLIGILVLGCLLLAVRGFSQDNNASRPGEVILEAPTFLCLGVRWYIEGDADADAKGSLECRQAGSEKWLPALPLFRVEGDKCQPPLPEGQTLLAGSVFDLKPGTAYELKMKLADPDGGDAEKTLRCSTRTEPVVDPEARVLYAVPGDGGGSGTESDPFRGLKAAHEAARPGDVIDLAPGVYRGSILMEKSGEEGRPIVWRGSSQGETVLDGEGDDRVISANGVRHVYLMNLTIRSGTWGIVAHGCQDVYVNRCRFLDIQTSFTAHAPGQKNITVTDSVFEGRSTWPRTKGIEETEGVEVQGDGNVVAHNRFSGFADAVSIFRETSHANDFYHNEISECTDDGIEMDYGGHNVRCFRNRLTNVFQGISVQPLYGGPCYIFHNAVYNIEVEPFKIHNSPSGILFFHNTTVKQGMPLLVWTSAPFSNSVFRNNLFIGTGGNYALEITAPATRADWDYDGFGGGPFQPFASWNGQRYQTFEDFTSRSGIEKDAALIEAGTAFASGLLPPDDIKKRFELKTNDLRLKAGTKAIDAGERLPNINDGFSGSAPDLGAYESGSALPHYGPRPEKQR